MKNMTIIEYANGERSIFDLAPDFTREDFALFMDSAFQELLNSLEMVDTPYEMRDLKKIFDGAFLELSKESFEKRF